MLAQKKSQFTLTGFKANKFPTKMTQTETVEKYMFSSIKC